MAAQTVTTERLEVPIEGMTCASCANRIERKLNKLEGVDASVNYATEQASVSFDPSATAAEQLFETISAAGYRPAMPSADPGSEGPAADPTAPLRQRLIFSAALTLPLLLISKSSSAGSPGVAAAPPNRTS